MSGESHRDVTGSLATRRTVDRREEDRVRFEVSDVGVTTVDPIERKRQAFLTTPGSPSTSAVTAVAIPAPVERAVELDVERLQTDRVSLVIVRDGDWNAVANLEEAADERFDDGEYVLDVPGSIKHYLHVRGSFRVAADDVTTFEFDPGTSVVLAARSKHDRPATTLTVPPDPAGIRAAISTFGTALKTTSPDRSWPNLRGHPPAVELGDELSIPREYGPPVPEVRVEVPDRFEYLFPAASLAYYLGARVVSADGGSPRLVTESGFAYDLGREGSVRSFESAVERVLKQTVFLECVIRSEGLVELPLYERRQIGEHLPLDFERLFEQPSPVRLASYLAVDYERIADHVPQWELTSHLSPRPRQAEVLPYVLDDLAVVKTSRGAGGSNAGSSSSGSKTSGNDGSAGADYVQLNDAGSLAAGWAGDGTPIGASKHVSTAFRNRFDVDPADPPIDVALVCNDSGMVDELDVERLYDSPTYPLAVEVYESLSRSALETLLEVEDVDFLHYVGHVDEGGFQCSDGSLDARTLAATDLQAFLLNACTSYDQAIGLVEAGAVGGLATWEEVVDAGAVEMGRTLARLLNGGYTLRAAISIARDAHAIGNQYLVVGDGGHTLVQPEDDGIPRHDVESIPERDEFRVASHAFPGPVGVGGVFHPYHESFDYHLIGNRTPEVEMPAAELAEFLSHGRMPVRLDTPSGRRLVWNTEFDPYSP